jgi:hypothetical protein
VKIDFVDLKIEKDKLKTLINIESDLRDVLEPNRAKLNNFDIVDEIKFQIMNDKRVERFIRDTVDKITNDIDLDLIKLSVESQIKRNIISN